MTVQRTLCLGCCSRADSDSSARRRKWRVLVPILHFWNSLGKEAPLHLLLFVVADIISFPDHSVRVSCHSVKILLCCREGTVGVHVCVYMCARACTPVCECRRERQERSSDPLHLSISSFPFSRLRPIFRQLPLPLPNHIVNRSPPKMKFLFFVSSLIIYFFFLRLGLQKEKKC